MDERTVRLLYLLDTREGLKLRSTMGDNSFSERCAISNAVATLGMCKGLAEQSREAVKPFSMSEWKEQSGGQSSLGAWAASQLLENTECDVTEDLEVVLSQTAGRWKQDFLFPSVNAMQSWLHTECL
jgi:hypothetical protein